LIALHSPGSGDTSVLRAIRRERRSRFLVQIRNYS
jgi:hypothetical protein